MSGSNTETETETETESGSPDQHPECEFDGDDLDIFDSVRNYYNLEEWECSRPVWEEASGNRCVWHASDGQTQAKPPAELEKTVDAGDLHGSAAIGVNLSGIDFPVETGFIDADLSGANLGNSDLSGGTFRRADLSGADLRSAYLPEAYLRYADLSEADLGNSDLSEADLGNSDLSKADLGNSDLPGAALPRVELSGADLRSVELSGADLRSADLSEAALFDADLSGADLIDANLSETGFIGSNLSRVDFTDTKLSEISLRGANITGADLREAIVDEVLVTATTTCNHLYEGYDASRLPRFIQRVWYDSSLNIREWDDTVRTYHNLKRVFSENALTSKAQNMYVGERRARNYQAKTAGAWSDYLLSLPSRFITGYGVRIRALLLWMLLLFVVSTAVYLKTGIRDTTSETIAYSVLAFTVAPPPPLPSGTRVQAMVMIETFFGTLSTVLLGYILGNRERI